MILNKTCLFVFLSVCAAKEQVLLSNGSAKTVTGTLGDVRENNVMNFCRFAWTSGPTAGQVHSTLNI